MSRISFSLIGSSCLPYCSFVDGVMIGRGAIGNPWIFARLDRNDVPPEMVFDTLQRHLVKIEQEINRKCFRTAKLFAEFNTAGLERGDIKTRFEAYRIALGRAGEQAWMGEDEIRNLENLPPRNFESKTGDGKNEPAA